MPLATRIFATGCQLAITIGVWNGDDWATTILALVAASTIWLAATTPEGNRKSGIAPGTTRAAISRLPIRVTATGRRFSTRIRRTRGSAKKGSTSRAISPVSSVVEATAAASTRSACSAFWPRRAKNSAAAKPASSSKVNTTLPALAIASLLRRGL